jgi:hypothetical protein
MSLKPGMAGTHACWSWAPARREEELKKYRVLCRTCRVNQIARRMSETERPLKHGIMNGYLRGCRCRKCRDAYTNNRHASYMRRKLREHNKEQAPKDPEGQPVRREVRPDTFLAIRRV